MKDKCAESGWYQHRTEHDVDRFKCVAYDIKLAPT
jgi:hypothetical protein